MKSLPHLYHFKMPGFSQEMLFSTLGALRSSAPLVCSQEQGKVRKIKVWLEHLQLLEECRDYEADHFKMLCFMLGMDLWPNILRTVGTIKAV